MNIIFMGTPDFAKESLERLSETKHTILAVVTNPDKPKGRGMKVISSPVKEFAIANNIPVYQPTKIKNNTEFIEQMKRLKPDLFCVVAYGKILPEELLTIPPLGAINVHGSLLPKYRGAAPIQWAVLKGDKTTGITTMYMDVGMDTGDMILKEEVEIGKNETTGELWDRLAKLGGKLLVETVNLIEEGKAPREKQGDNYTVAPMLSKEMAQIHWDKQTAREIHNLVRGLNPIMGAYTFFHGKKIKFWKVEIVEAEKEMKAEIKSSAPNGTVVFSNAKEGLWIKTKEGILSILEIQGENAKRMSVQEYLRGNPIDEGERFEPPL